MITANEARELVTKWHDGRGRRVEMFMAEAFPKIEADIKEAAADGYRAVVKRVPTEVVDEVVKALTNEPASFKVVVEDDPHDVRKVLTISWGE